MSINEENDVLKPDIRKYLISGVMGIIVLLTAQNLLAQLPDVATSRIRVDRSKIQESWSEAVQYLRNGDFENAVLVLDDLNLKKLELGFHNLSLHSLVLVKEAQSAGTYSVTWDATDESGSMVSTGVYLYQIRAGELVESMKMLSVR